MVACGFWSTGHQALAVVVDDDGRAAPPLVTVSDDERWELLGRVDAEYGLDCEHVFTEDMLRHDTLCRFAIERSHVVFAAPPQPPALTNSGQLPLSASSGARDCFTPDAPSVAHPILTEVRALWRLALPLALAQAGQATMGLVDTAVLGRLSSEAQAAGGLGNSLSFTVTFFGMGVMMALDPLVSQAIGANRPVEARTHYWTGVWLALLTSVALTLPLVALGPLMRLVGVDPAIEKDASTYVDWRLAATAGQLLFISARSYLQGLGKTGALVFAMVAANILNFILDVQLVFGWGPFPAMGVAGAALATTLCTWAQFLFLIPALGPAPQGVQRRLSWSALWQAARVGLPVGAHLLAEGGVFGLAGLLAGRLGTASSAAHQVALTWLSITFCVAVGIGSAGAVRVGWGVGARNRLAARRAGAVAFGSGLAFMSFTALCFVLFRADLARAVSPTPSVIAVASSLFFVGAVFQISDGTQAIGAGVLRGYGDTRMTFYANVVGHWLVGLPLSFLLGVWGELGVVGLWWGLSAGLTFVAIGLFGRFLALSRHEVKMLSQPELQLIAEHLD